MRAAESGGGGVMRGTFLMGGFVQVQAYLHFEGRCDEAIAFYQSALGAKLLMRMTYRQCPEVPAGRTFPPEILDKVMHATLRIGESEVFVSDGHCSGKEKFAGFSLALTFSGDEETGRCFDALAVGGRVVMPIEKTFFSSRFGMVVDRLGVLWTVYTRTA
jgi:PhnB protein